MNKKSLRGEEEATKEETPPPSSPKKDTFMEQRSACVWVQMLKHPDAGDTVDSSSLFHTLRVMLRGRNTQPSKEVHEGLVFLKRSDLLARLAHPPPLARPFFSFGCVRRDQLHEASHRHTPLILCARVRARPCAAMTSMFPLRCEGRLALLDRTAREPQQNSFFPLIDVLRIPFVL